MMQETWIPSRIDRLRQLAGDGLTMREIAADMHLTRNAVIGKLARLGLSTQARPGLTDDQRFARLTKRRRVDAEAKRIRRTEQPIETGRIYLAGNGAVRPVYEFPGQPKPRCIEVGPLHLSLADLTQVSCRYPYGDGPFTFCGHAKFAGHPYCEGHYALTSKQRAA